MLTVTRCQSTNGACSRERIGMSAAHEDRLDAAARRYHQVLKRLRQNARRASNFAVAMARDGIRADLEHAEDELHDAADAYGKGVP